MLARATSRVRARATRALSSYQSTRGRMPGKALWTPAESLRRCRHHGTTLKPNVFRRRSWNSVAFGAENAADTSQNT